MGCIQQQQQFTDVQMLWEEGGSPSIRTASGATSQPHFMTKTVKSTYVPAHRMYWHQVMKTV